MSKRPIPVKPKLEKIDPEESDYKDPLSDDSSEPSEKKSKKKLFSFLLMVMIACCAGGYGYIEYKKKKDAGSEEVVKVDDDQKDPMEAGNPDNADTSGDDVNNEEVVNTDDEIIVASVDTSETLKSVEEPELEEVPFESEPDENKSTEESLTDEPDEELELDFGSENDTEKTEAPIDDEPLFSISDDEKLEDDKKLEENEKLEDDTFEVLADETKTAQNSTKQESENESAEFEAFDDTEKLKEEDFVQPKESEPVEKIKPKKRTQQRQSRPKRKVAKRPPTLNSGQSTRENTGRQTNSRTTTRTKKRTSTTKKVLKPVGNKDYRSPAGLIYGPGSREGHRIKHVLKHAKDQPGRSGKHGVFKARNPDELFLLIDEAYKIAKKRGPPVHIRKDRNRTIYTVDMKRKVGYIGGQTGGKRNHPSAYKIRFVLEGNRIITAFPM